MSPRSQETEFHDTEKHKTGTKRLTSLAQPKGDGGKNTPVSLKTTNNHSWGKNAQQQKQGPRLVHALEPRILRA